MKENNSNKQWKRVPFDIELAKKIQSGEVEGRIVNEIGADVQIVSLNVENTLGPIAVLAHCVDGKDYIYTFYENGVPSRKGVYRLLLELPEETPKQLTLGDCKCREIVYIKDKCEESCFLQVKKEGEQCYCNCRTPMVIVTDINDIPLLCTSDTICWREKPTKEETPKHEFKPFDKVLVRDTSCEAWRPDIFYFMACDGQLYSCLRSDWEYCIPYEGNQHLLGTTDEPKEE